MSSSMGYLKGKGALMMFYKRANLKCKFRNRHCWSAENQVSTDRLNQASIWKYIQAQEKHNRTG